MPRISIRIWSSFTGHTTHFKDHRSGNQRSPLIRGVTSLGDNRLMRHTHAHKYTNTHIYMVDIHQKWKRFALRQTYNNSRGRHHTERRTSFCSPIHPSYTLWFVAITTAITNYTPDLTARPGKALLTDCLLRTYWTEAAISLASAVSDPTRPQQHQRPVTDQTVSVRSL